MAATGSSGEISKLPTLVFGKCTAPFPGLVCSPKALQLAVVHLPFAEWELRSDQVVAKHLVHCVYLFLWEAEVLLNLNFYVWTFCVLFQGEKNTKFL